MEIWGSVIVAIITGAFSFAGVVFSSQKQHDKTISEVTTQVELIKKDINNLEKKQDKHNTLVERMYGVETSVKVLEERIKKLEE